MLKRSRGESITEYVVLIGMVTMALIGMQVYLKRGIQGVVKYAADELGRQEDAEIDPTKGTKIDSHSVVYNTQASSQRIRAFTGGSKQTDFSASSSITGTSTYKTERED